MKNLFLILAASIFTFKVIANPVSPSQAMSIARNMAGKMKKPTADLQLTGIQNEVKGRDGKTLADPAFYAFNIQGEDGFVIVAGDDQFPQIIGYSTEGEIPQQYDQLPCCLRFYLEMYSMYVDEVRNGNAQAPQRAHGQSEGTPIVDELVSAKWGQDEPFNIYCPSNSTLGQSIVGCVATAMSQIMYKWKWPETGTGMVSYTNKYGNTSVNFSQSNYNWAIMKNKYGTLDKKKETGKAVAKLCYDCGVSTYMSYGEAGSGTHSQYVLQAMYKNFRYKASTLDYLLRDCCNTKDEFMNRIKRELNAGRPVYMSAASSTDGGSDAAGHAFVLDGYDTADYIHVNWGWTGTANGYYDIDVMDAGGYKFILSQDIIFGIQPDYEGNDNKQANQYRLYVTKPFTVNNTTATVDKDFKANMSEFYNNFPFANEYDFAIALYTHNGELLDIVSNTFNERLGAWKGYTSYSNFTCNIPKKYDNGGYLLRLVSRQPDFDDWVLVDMIGGSEVNKLPIVIKNSTISFNEYPTAVNDIISDANILRTEYFGIGGQKIVDVENAKGIIIEKRTYSNGTTKTFKRMAK